MKRNLEGSRVLLTGGRGFLAGYLTPKLTAAGAEVTCLDLREGFERSVARSKAQQIECDIANHSIVQKIKGSYDYVVHLAGVATPLRCEHDPALAFRVNVQGTFNMLRLAKEKRVKKFVFASSALVYGTRPRYIPTDEKHPISPQDTYATTKTIGEYLCRLFYRNYNLHFTTARLFNGYGPGQSEDYFIPAMISSAKKGRIELRGRRFTRDFVYADDVAEAYRLMLISDYVGEVNIGTGKQTKLEYVARHVADAFGAELTFVGLEPPGPIRMQCDTKRAERILGWKAKTPIEFGLRMTIMAAKKS